MGRGNRARRDLLVGEALEHEPQDSSQSFVEWPGTLQCTAQCLSRKTASINTLTCPRTTPGSATALDPCVARNLTAAAPAALKEITQDNAIEGDRIRALAAGSASRSPGLPCEEDRPNLYCSGAVRDNIVRTLTVAST